MKNFTPFSSVSSVEQLNISWVFVSVSVKSTLGWSLEPSSDSFLAPVKNFCMHPRFTMPLLPPKINKNKIIAITWNKYIIVNLVHRGFCLFDIRTNNQKPKISVKEIISLCSIYDMMANYWAVIIGCYKWSIIGCYKKSL